MASLAAQYSLQIHQHCADCARLTVKPKVGEIVVYCQSILCVWSSRGRAAVSACPAAAAAAAAASGSSHPADPYLLPLPCVRPSRCSRAASTSFTLRHRAPGESQPPLLDGITGVSDQHRSQAGGRVAVRPSVAPRGATRSFLRHDSAALHSREPLTNEAAGPGRGRHRPANQEPSPVN